MCVCVRVLLCISIPISISIYIYIYLSIYLSIIFIIFSFCPQTVLLSCFLSFFLYCFRSFFILFLSFNISFFLFLFSLSLSLNCFFGYTLLERKHTPKTPSAVNDLQNCPAAPLMGCAKPTDLYGACAINGAMGRRDSPVWHWSLETPTPCFFGLPGSSQQIPKHLLNNKGTVASFLQSDWMNRPQNQTALVTIGRPR